jgi:hypothetical protein
MPSAPIACRDAGFAAAMERRSAALQNCAQETAASVRREAAMRRRQTGLSRPFVCMPACYRSAQVAVATPVGVPVLTSSGGLQDLFSAAMVDIYHCAAILYPAGGFSMDICCAADDKLVFGGGEHARCAEPGREKTNRGESGTAGVSCSWPEVKVKITAMIITSVGRCGQPACCMGISARAKAA